MKMGLIDESDIHNASFTWENEFRDDRFGVCFFDLRLVAISRFLDYSIVSNIAFDEIVYHEILHLRQVNMGIAKEDPHDEQFRKWERSYPFFVEAERELNVLSKVLVDVCKMSNIPEDINPEWSYALECYSDGRRADIIPEPT